MRPLGAKLKTWEVPSGTRKAPSFDRPVRLDDRSAGEAIRVARAVRLEIADFLERAVVLESSPFVNRDAGLSFG